MAQDGWEEVTDPNEARKVLGADTFARMSKNSSGGKGLSVQAQKFLNDLSEKAQNAREVGKIYEQANDAVTTLKPGPNRGRFLEIATPEEGGGFLDTIGGILVGGPARLTGAITPEETDAFQTLRKLQSANVLTRQLEQKGVQTESDAARLMLTELSPSKSPKVNQEIIAQGRQKTKRDQAKAAFYTIWANKYGLNGMDPEGNTADQLWAKAGDYITARLIGGKPAGFNRQGRQQSPIKVLSRTKVK